MKRNLRNTFFIILLLLVVYPSSFAQTPLQVRGVVSNANGPLSSVSVIVKGTQNGAITDVNGKYSLSNVSGSGVLIFSSIGYENQEISINNRRQIDVLLKASTESLDQVVVIGYGTQNKRKITGSVAVVDMSQSKALPNTNISQALRGTVPGVQFTASGRPGQDGDILIRGQNSLSASNNPLIVVDGIIFNGSLSDFSPADIQTISILKDASAASIYGSRAANGVILITSKKGTTDKPTIRFDGFYGLSDFARQVKLLSPERYLQRAIDYRIQAGLSVDPEHVEQYLEPSEAENYKNGIVHDPWKSVSQKGRLSSYHLSVSGKSNFTNYYIAAELSDEQGLIFNDNQKRTSFRVNLDNKITKWLDIGINTMFVQRDLSGINANIYNANRSSPYATYFYPDGEPTQYTVPTEQSSTNPLRDALLTKNEEIYNNLFSNIYLQANVPFLKGLQYRMNFSPNYLWQHNYNFYKQDQHLPDVNTTFANKFNQQDFDWVLENIVTYKRKINANNNFDLTLLYGRHHYGFESTTANSDKLNSDVLGYNNLGLGSILTNSSLAQQSEGISSMARLNYQFMQKYFLTITARRDASSVFAANNKHATFPSGALAWMISDESFLKKANFIDMLKLRVSYGAVGNQAISPYQSLSVSDQSKYVFGDGGATVLGLFPSKIGNNDLKWETSYTSNAAIDFDLFHGRLRGTLEIYNTNTKNLLVQRSIPIMSGFNTILTNIGETNNKGFEVSLNSINIQTKKFKWSSNFIFSFNKNKILHLYHTDINGDGKEDDDISNSWFIGQPINSYYDYIIEGIYQEGDADIPTGYAPGWVRLKDLNGDGIINADDRTIVGSGGDPKYQFGMKNNFSYGNFSLSVFVNGMYGWISPFEPINPIAANGRAINQLDAGWWTAENKSNTRASLVYTNPLRHNWYISRNFVRIQDVSISYQIPDKILNKIKLSNLQVFVSGKNLYLFTNWLGSDPESGGNYGSVGSHGSNDLFPMPRTFTVGFNMAF